MSDVWQPSATVIADSIAYGHRLTSLALEIHPRAVEHLLTHRALSRSGASRRAIPLWRQIEQVDERDVFPAKWGAEQPGMQSGDQIAAEKVVEARRVWRHAKRQAIVAAGILGELGVHKEVASAPLAPYQPRTYIVTATEWANFMRLRLAPDAQADIRLVAQFIDQALNESTPALVGPGEWHLPYIVEGDHRRCADLGIDVRIVSGMRCARVSFKAHGGGRDALIDFERGHELITKSHWSPFEHVATPAGPMAETANFRGWQQLRTQMGA